MSLFAYFFAWSCMHMWVRKCVESTRTIRRRIILFACARMKRSKRINKRKTILSLECKANTTNRRTNQPTNQPTKENQQQQAKKRVYHIVDGTSTHSTALCNGNTVGNKQVRVHCTMYTHICIALGSAISAHRKHTHTLTHACLCVCVLAELNWITAPYQHVCLGIIIIVSFLPSFSRHRSPLPHINTNTINISTDDFSLSLALPIPSLSFSVSVRPKIPCYISIPVASQHAPIWLCVFVVRFGGSKTSSIWK